MHALLAGVNLFLLDPLRYSKQNKMLLNFIAQISGHNTVVPSHSCPQISGQRPLISTIQAVNPQP